MLTNTAGPNAWARTCGEGCVHYAARMMPLGMQRLRMYMTRRPFSLRSKVDIYAYAFTHGLGPNGPPWALMGQALMGPPWALMGPDGPGPNGRPWPYCWALMGRAPHPPRALIGQAQMGPLGPHGPSHNGLPWALMGWALMDWALIGRAPMGPPGR